MTTLQSTKNSSGLSLRSLILMIVNFFTGSSVSDEDKAYSEIARNIRQTKLNFFRTRNSYVQPEFAYFFYEVYRALAPIKAYFPHHDMLPSLRNFIIEESLPQYKEMLRSLSHEELLVRSKTVPLEVLDQECQEKLNSIIEALKTSEAVEIELYLNDIDSFLDFVHFDFYRLLKKFDAQFTENDFRQPYKFLATPFSVIKPMLEEIILHISTINLQANWHKIFTHLEDYSGRDLPWKEAWMQLIPQLEKLQTTDVLTLMYRYLHKDSRWVATAKIPERSMLAVYVDYLRASIADSFKKIQSENSANSINKAISELFGDAPITQLKNYSDDVNNSYIKLGISGFKYCKVLSTLSFFLNSYFREAFTNFVNGIIVPAHWHTPGMVPKLTDVYGELSNVSKLIARFNEDLEENASYGKIIRIVKTKAERSKSELPRLVSILANIDNDAEEILQSATSALSKLTDYLQELQNDTAKERRSKLITNWPALAQNFKMPLPAFLGQLISNCQAMIIIISHIVPVSTQASDAAAAAQASAKLTDATTAFTAKSELASA